MSINKFDPDDLSPEALKNLGKHIESFLNDQSHIMVITDNISEKEKERFLEGRARAKKLVEKLKKGKTSMFVEKEQEI